MVPKPGKDPTDVTSYRTISLLSTISKLLEKLLSRHISTAMNPNTWFPEHQFGFRKAHSTIQQCHRITHTIQTALEHKQYCTAAFLDVSQAFDKGLAPWIIIQDQTTTTNKLLLPAKLIPTRQDLRHKSQHGRMIGAPH